MPEAVANKNKGRVPWQTDGPTLEINSMAVIIDWLTREGNYNHWRGGDRQNDTTKLGIASEISQLRHHRREASVGDTREDQPS